MYLIEQSTSSPLDKVVQSYKSYLIEKTILLASLNPQQQASQLSENTTPLESFFASVHRMSEFEEKLTTDLLSMNAVAIEQPKFAELIKVVIANIFATECSLFTAILVLVALFTDRCCFGAASSSNHHIVLQQFIEVINILIKIAKKFIHTLRAGEYLV